MARPERPRRDKGSAASPGPWLEGGEMALASGSGWMVNRADKATGPTACVTVNFLRPSRYPMHDATEDTLFHGRLICRQPGTGYRFSVDSVLAAGFCRPGSEDRVLDLGAGCGVIGLILAHRFPRLTVCCLELQEELAALARANGEANNFGPRFTVIRADVRAPGAAFRPEAYDLVVCNPPYRQQGSGRVNPSDQAARARHEGAARLADFVRAAAAAVRNRGRVILVFPAARHAVLLATLQACRLTPKKLQPVFSCPGQRAAKLVLVEAVKNGGEQSDLFAPLYIYQCRNGGYSAEMAALYEEDGCWPRS